MPRIKEQDTPNPEDRIEPQQTLKAALIKATGVQPGRKMREREEDDNTYYTLTTEQMNALVNGNMEKIESWVSNLDKGQATRLLRWLLKQGW